MLWHVLWGPQPLLDAGLALPRPPSFLCALSLSPMTPIGSACPHLGPGLFSSVRAIRLGWFEPKSPPAPGDVCLLRYLQPQPVD